jgi:hypothetical protein
MARSKSSKSSTILSSTVAASARAIKKTKTPKVGVLVGSPPLTTPDPSIGGVVAAVTGASAPVATTVLPIPGGGGLTSIVGTLAGVSPPAAALVTAPNVADTPPAVTLPAVPTGFVAPNLRTFRGSYPNKLEVAAMPKAANELGQFVDYAVLLGAAATPAPAVIDAINRGLAWRTLRGDAEAWEQYVKSEDAMQWKSTMGILAEIKPLFLFALSKNPSLATSYPWLTQLLVSGKEIAKLANATRTKNRATKSAGAAAAATAAAVATATAAGEAVGKAAATVAVVPKTVTMSA